MKASFAILGALLLTAPHALPAQSRADSGWKFSAAPYGWGAGINGNVAVFGSPTVDIDANFGDLLDVLDFAAMVMGEGHKGPYRLFADLIYTRISDTKGTPRGILATSASAGAKTFLGTFGVGYALIDNAYSHLDFNLGARIWSLKNDLSFQGGALNGRSASDGETWIDGLLGVRGQYDWARHWFVTGWGLAGGGEARGDWDVAAGLGYRLNDIVAVALGYRALGVSYDKNQFVYDVIEHGPILGLVLRSKP